MATRKSKVEAEQAEDGQVEVEDNVAPDAPCEEVDRVEQAIIVLHELRDAVAARTERYEAALAEIKKLLKGIAGAVAIGLATFALALVLSLSNRSILDKINEVTDPKGDYARDAQSRTHTLLVGLSVELDCRARRVAAHLPAPNPTLSCTEQTPREVYPGG